MTIHFQDRSCAASLRLRNPAEITVLHIRDNVHAALEIPSKIANNFPAGDNQFNYTSAGDFSNRLLNFVAPTQPPPGGLPYKSDGDARRLALGCIFTIFAHSGIA